VGIHRTEPNVGPIEEAHDRLGSLSPVFGSSRPFKNGLLPGQVSEGIHKKTCVFHGLEFV